MTAVDAWIDAIPDDQYGLCPCGCGMKFRYAIKDGIEKHEARFTENYKETSDDDATRQAE